MILDRFWWSTWVYGSANSANLRSLELMIEIERNHWGNVVPNIVFLVTRTIPVTPLYDINDWRHIAALYSDLASRENSNYRIEVINNEQTIDVANSEIFRLTSTLLVSD